ncbi:MAG: hypothetical protein LBQ15_12095 [Clostridium sp.]|jgi:hypothetical protein|nr:hypothetical protein [Clostridium sp.]
MAIGPLELSTISRSQDLTAIKQNEVNKGFVDQSHIGQQTAKDVDQLVHQVHSGDNAQWQRKKEDGKEKGRNLYSGDGGRQRGKQKTQGRVIVKGKQGFDRKV